jgi:hypothetical protein
MQYNVADGAATFTLRPLYDIACEWFDFPPATSTVNILKYDCPAGVDHTASSESKDPQHGPLCKPQPGVTFTLNYSALTTGSILMTTDA